MTLVMELKREIIGGRIVATEFYKKERAAYFIIKKDRTRIALGFLYHPAGAGTFLVPASKIRIETREKPWPVFDLEGAIITDVEQVGFDRIFSLTTTKENSISHILFEALGPNGNIWLLDDTRFIQATLRKKKYNQSTPYSAPPLPDRLNPMTLTVELLESRLAETPSYSLSAFMERNILGMNRTLAREIVARAGIDIEETGSSDAATLEAVVKTVKEILGRFSNPDVSYLHDHHGVPEAYPLKLSVAGITSQKYKTLSLAVMAVCTTRRAGIETVDHEKTTKDAVKRAVKRLERRLTGIEGDLKEASDYEHYRKIAELLQISFNIIKKGMAEIVVTDIYTDPPVELTIALEPALTPNENVEVYFKRYRKGRNGHKLLKRRLEITKSELASLMEIKSTLDNDFETALKQYDQELMTLLPRETSGRSEVQPRLPYREHTLSTGLRVFVGREGADNDRTTFEFARPYELWFHVQQCPGSHVVIRYPNKSFKPSKAEIEETASITAWHSKARNDSLVPVIYTERRYVRKPRKAKPGLVTVEREKSIMVTPRKPDTKT